jgi:hypothetical protein
MRHLGKLAEQNACAILLVGHFNKFGSSPQYRGLGSIDIYNAARSVLTVGKMAWEENMRAMVHNKSNLSAPGVSQAYRFDKDSGFEWLGDYEVTVEEMLKGKRKDKPQQESPQPESQSDKARRLITDALSGGRYGKTGGGKRYLHENLQPGEIRLGDTLYPAERALVLADAD